jgi:hypothetical protein
MGTTVGIIFDTFHLCGYAFFIAFEVDNSVVLFVSATTVAGGYSAIVVASSCFGFFI